MAAYMGALFWLSSLPQAPLQDVFTISDKLAHAAAYFGLCLVARMPAETLFRRRGYAILFAFSVSSVYGAVDELHQSLTPGRMSDIYDWAADVVGAAIGAALLIYFEIMRKEKGSKVKGGKE